MATPGTGILPVTGNRNPRYPSPRVHGLNVYLRTAWAALVDVARTTPATRTAQTVAQVRNVLRRLRAAGHGREAAPLFVFDARLQRRRPR